MKPYAYYQTTSVSIPRKDDYMTIYYYKKGMMVGMKRQFEIDFEPVDHAQVIVLTMGLDPYKLNLPFYFSLRKECV